MSIFASQTQVTIPIPFDAPHTVTIRKLTGDEHMRAQLADMVGNARFDPWTWASRFKRMADTGDPKALEALRDPLIGYSRVALIRAGLVAWSYTKPIAATPAQGETPAYDPILDLDDDAMQFIATELLRLTKPALFITAEAAEGAQKEPEAAAPAA